ncbi:hypothetical protein [Granulicella arctica]|uniref:hypothetical protein n=1 Tax=Granulicella arctica TaxID=940613 RepID=UPI0021E02CFA|nr:hypothetical protein [Granulicella arctica]
MAKMRWLAVVVVAGVLGGSAGSSRAAALDTARDAPRGLCASTPAAALVDARRSNEASATGLAEMHGYRVEAVRWDPLLRRGWAVIRSCDHLDRPAITIPTDLPVVHAEAGLFTAGVRASAALPIVRAGDLVRLWKSERFAHIEMMGTSEENGAIGARVRIRLATPRDLEGQTSAPQYLAGVVRGPADVEMEP